MTEELTAEILRLQNDVEFLKSHEFLSRKSLFGSVITGYSVLSCVPGIRAFYPNFNLNGTNIDGMNLVLNGTTNLPILSQSGFSSYATLDASDNQRFSNTDSNFNRENNVDNYMQNPGLTIGTWIRLATLATATRGIIGQWNPFTTDKSYGLWMSSSELISGSVSSDGSTNQVAEVTTKTLVASQWYFTAMVWVPSTSVKTFVYDPTAETLDTATNTTSISATLHQVSPVDFTWGCRYAAGGAIQGWDGDLAWGFMSIAALSDAWVSAIFNSTRGSLGV